MPHPPSGLRRACLWVLACGLGLGVFGPATTQAAPLWQGEEVLDADGYLGLKPGLPFIEREAIARWGRPLTVQGMGPGRRHWVWGPSPEVEGQGADPRSLVVEAHATPLGWVTDWVLVGAERHPKPLADGLAPHQGPALRAHFRVQKDEGWALEQPELGLRWVSEALSRADAFEALRMAKPSWAEALAHSLQVHEARRRWVQGPQGVDQDAMRAALGQAGEGGQLLTPAVVVALRRPLGGFVPVHLRLPEHSRAWAPGPNEEPPGLRQDLILRLPEAGSVARLREGDIVVLRAPWEGFQAAAPGQAWLRLGRPDLAAAFPQGFVAHELWQGAPNPGLRR